MRQLQRRRARARDADAQQDERHREQRPLNRERAYGGGEADEDPLDRIDERCGHERGPHEHDAHRVQLVSALSPAAVVDAGAHEVQGSVQSRARMARSQPQQ